MKKILFLMTLLVMGVSFAFVQTNADIKFDKTTHDFGKFSENSPVVSCVFTFTNIGDAPLVIHQAGASCSLMRMYSTRIYKGAHHAGQKGNNQGDL